MPRFVHAEDASLLNLQTLDPQAVQGVKQYAELYVGNALTQPSALGNFGVANIIAGFLFGSIGFIAFVYGKKMSLWRPLVLGLVLMAYTYFISNTILLYGIGIVLCVLLYFWRE